MTKSAPLPKGYAPTLDTRSVPWESLRPHPRNPNNGDVEVIGESIDANGVYKPLTVAQDGTILAGHHVWEALGERQTPRVDVVVLPIDPMSDAALRIMVVDNRSARLARPDESLELEILRALQEADALLGSGFEDGDLDEIAAAVRRAEHTPLGYKADEPPSPSEEGSGESDETPQRSHEQEPTRPAGSLQDDASRYESKGLRYVQVEFPASAYPAVVAALKAKREEFGVTTNTEALGRWLGVDVSDPR